MLLRSGISYSEFVTNTFYASLFSPCILHTPPISYSSYYKHNMIWSISFEVCHYVTIFGLPLLPSWLSVLKQQLMFFPLRLGPSFTSIKRTDKEREFNNNSVFIFLRSHNSKQMLKMFTLINARMNTFDHGLSHPFETLGGVCEWSDRPKMCWWGVTLFPNAAEYTTILSVPIRRNIRDCALADMGGPCHWSRSN